MGERGRRWSVVSVASSGYKTEATDSPISLSVSSHLVCLCALCACPYEYTMCVELIYFILLALTDFTLLKLLAQFAL